MAKDPAFLFYPNDFESKTKMLTNEQVGIYLRLLITQFQYGHLTEKMFKFYCPNMDEEILSYFTVDNEGKYYQDRLDEEIEKRKKFTSSRRNNLKGTNQYSKKNIDKTSHMDGHMTTHMEDVNENVNVNRNKSLPKIIEKTIFSEFLEKNCPTVLKLKIQMTAEQAQKLADEFGVKDCQEIFEAMENWMPLSKKSKSVYLTAKTWLTKRKTTATTNGKSKRTFTEAAMDWLNQ